jgi:hypothetical protein
MNRQCEAKKKDICEIKT